MKKVYVLRIECGDPWARYWSDAEFSTNKKQLEDLAKRINKLDSDAGAYVAELEVKQSLTKQDISNLLSYYCLV